LAISREGTVESKPNRSFTLQENDILFFLGQANKLNDIMALFKECEA
jgi:Trk K+ transport system NAD-binding subunit